MHIEPTVTPQPKSPGEQESEFTSAGAPEPGKVGAAEPACEDFLEGREDPSQSEELERQQDA